MCVCVCVCVCVREREREREREGERERRTEIIQCFESTVLTKTSKYDRKFIYLRLFVEDSNVF